MVDTPNNGKLLVRIDERVKQIGEMLTADRLYAATRFDAQDQKIDGLARELAQANTVHAACMATQEARWENHDKTDEERNRKRNQGDTLAAGTGVVAAAIAAVYTALKNGP